MAMPPARPRVLPAPWWRALGTACLLVALPAAAADMPLPATMSLDGQTLRLVSCGVRDTLWIDHYVAGLYVPEGGSAQAVRDPDRPAAVRMRVLESRYLPERIPRKWREALDGELAREPMFRVRRAYGGLHDGDVVVVTYEPGQGVTMRVNGRQVLREAGHHTVQAILQAWAEGDPVSGKLQRLPMESPCRPEALSAKR